MARYFIPSRTALLLVGVLTLGFTRTWAAPAMTPADTTETAAPAKRSLLNRFLDYLNDANKNKRQRRFDFGIIGGPHYSTDTKLGLGLVAAGLYHTHEADTLMPPSNISIFGDVSTVGFYMLGVRGTHLFPADRYRLDYTVHFYSFPTKYWGIGYDMGNASANESKMKRWQAAAKVTFLLRLADNLYAGPTATYDFVRGHDIERPELLNGMAERVNSFGAGFSLVYDSRDVMTQPRRGAYINLSQCFRPRFLGNDYAFSTTDLRASAYGHAWRRATLAGEFRSTLNFGNPSWAMMSMLGSSHSMRGYYEGRYRDKHKIETQVELRQHLWKRNGIVLWAGAGTVFDRFAALRADHILPNFGLGYRWEFKKDVNVRLDYGFGKSGQSGFLFNINEAF